MKIYTKTGDKGQTALFSGKKVPKNSSFIEAYGTVDELNAFLGWAAVVAKAGVKKELLQIQNDLHSLCADLATPSDSKASVERLEADRAQTLEVLIDDYEKELKPLRQFILAGGNELAARLHVARTVARRAERQVVNHAAQEQVNPEIIVYLNRLSDFLFVLARIANKRGKVKDVFWKK